MRRATPQNESLINTIPYLNKTRLQYFHVSYNAACNFAEGPPVGSVRLLICIPPCLPVAINPACVWVYCAAQSNILTTGECEPK